jgi:hypothetical protein
MSFFVKIPIFIDGIVSESDNPNKILFFCKIRCKKSVKVHNVTDILVLSIPDVAEASHLQSK